MKSELVEKLISICETGSQEFAYSVKNLTTKQLKEVEVELTKHFEFSRIVWMELPSGLTEDGTTPIVAHSQKLTDSDPKHTGKIGYVYNISFTPKMYDPKEMYEPVKDGCLFAPIIYNPETFEPKQSITLTWSPETTQDLDAPPRTYEDDKQMVRDMLERVLANPEEYRPKGFRACLVRYAVV